MKYLQCILYGAIVGKWLLNVKKRIFPGQVQGRYAIIGMHSSKEEFILIGRTADKVKAEEATRFVDENTMFYIPICYDLLDPDDRVEFERRLYCPYIENEDEYWVHEARRICGAGE